MENQSIAQARAERLKRVRNLANLSRKEMCDGTTLNISTLKGWEVARHGGLTEKGAQKILERVAKSGVSCTLEWLLSGEGIPPCVIFEDDQSAETIPFEQQELNLFLQHYPNSLAMTIQDDAMEPFYAIGDLVAGVLCDEKAQGVGQNALVKLASGEKLLRSVRQGEDGQSVILVSLNPNTTVSEPVLYGAEIDSLAIVKWHRKPC